MPEGKDELDLSSRRDQALLRQGIAAGWELSHEQLARYSKALDEALDIAKSKGNERSIVSCVKTMATLVSQVQHDEDKASGHGDGLNVTVVWSDR